MATQQKISVLIVDDRPENLTSLEALLGDMGLDLVTAPSGNDALRCVLEADFALVLLDVQMPGMDGFETAELMRNNPKTSHLPIILVTAGMKEKSHLFKGYDTGAVDYLVKPIDPVILRSKVRVFCELFRQRRELEQRGEELQQSYERLERETAERIRVMEELRIKDQLLINQSRMAALGEMLGNIAHQWRQPLNLIGLKIQEIGLSGRHGECSREMLEANVAKAMEILLHLSKTIDYFRIFSTPDQEKVLFKVDEVIATTVSLIGERFKDEGVVLETSSAGEAQIVGYPNEYAQALLNILWNSRDALQERQISEARIAVRSSMENGRGVVTITDNAGGIDEGIIAKVFDPYFTTKELGKGTGVGLYLSKTIIEKRMGGRLTVRNVEKGAEFRIEV
jgi:signal transduction histidine kinase